VFSGVLVLGLRARRRDSAALTTSFWPKRSPASRRPCFRLLQTKATLAVKGVYNGGVRKTSLRRYYDSPVSRRRLNVRRNSVSGTRQRSRAPTLTSLIPDLFSLNSPTVDGGGSAGCTVGTHKHPLAGLWRGRRGRAPATGCVARSQHRRESSKRAEDHQQPAQAGARRIRGQPASSAGAACRLAYQGETDV
jgi:hypothetical protein